MNKHSSDNNTYPNELTDIESLLVNWTRSASIMHVSHHYTASLYSKYQRLLGILASVFCAIVSTSLFVSLTQSDNQRIIIITGVISLLTSILTAVLTVLKADQKSQAHYKAAVEFQHLRRVIEEELVNVRKGKIKDNYELIREEWNQALKQGLPIPQKVFNKFSKKLNDK